MIVLLATTAWGQATYPDGVPDVATDLFRPSMDGGPFLATESSGHAESAVATFATGWARRLLLVRIDGAEEVLVEDALALHVGVRGGTRHVQLGVSAPAYPLVATDRVRAVLGDPTVDARLVTAGAHASAGLRLRVGGQLGGYLHQVGYPGPCGEIGALGEVRLGSLLVSTNAGYRWVPQQQLGEQVLDDVVWTHSAIGAQWDGWAGSLEVMAQAQVIGGSASPRPAAVEALAGIQRRWDHGLIRAGVGRGVTAGVGSPAFRLVLGVSWLGRSEGTSSP